MRIAICDDDQYCLQSVTSIINAYAEIAPMEISVSTYLQSSDLLDDIFLFGGFDIYILDIIMSGINGIELGLEVRQFDHAGKIIYLTSSSEYALDAFKTKASAYLLKPVQKETIFDVINEVVGTMANRREKSLIVKTKENSVRLTFDSIMYAALINRKITYYLSNGNEIESITIRSSFSESVHDLLKDNRFALCGASMLVNMYYIKMVDQESIVFRNGKNLYIGKKACRELRSIWSDFWINKEDD